MSKSKFVWVQIDEEGVPIRIIKTAKLARALPDGQAIEWDKEDATGKIRWQVYERSKNEFGQAECEWCSRNVRWEKGYPDSGEMHERTFRGCRDTEGNRGEVSVANSVFICRPCHTGPNGAHGARRWHKARIDKGTK